MKAILMTLLLTLPLLTACASKTGATAPGEDMLVGQRFTLRDINGESFSSTERTPEIEFLENMMVVGQTCNRFRGQGTLKDDTLLVAESASTMMFCTDSRLNRMERDLAEMLRRGATVHLDGDTLTLRSGSTWFTYTRAH